MPFGEETRGAAKSLSFFHRKEEEERPHPAPGLASGKVVGDFRLVELIGQGGMGQVWEAEQVSLGKRHVAVKFVRPERVTERQLELFQREARAGGRLHHPGIVTVHGYGQSDGLAWIAMEFVEGCWTLRDFLDEVARAGEVPEGYDRHVARFVAEIAEAMHTAHEAAVIHRDLKPQNVLIAPDEHPKVTDFGLARITDETAMSETGDFAGTYFYMSPEQVAARRAGIDHRTDIFSLGVILYELLALRRPFEGDTSHQVAAQILAKDPPALRTIRSRVPRDLAVIVGKALEKDPDKRFQTMTEFAADLRRHLANEPIHARPPTRLDRSVKWVKRNPTKSTAASIAAVTFTAITWLLIQNIRTNRALQFKTTEAEASAREARANARTAQANEERASASELAAQASAAVAEAERTRAVENEAAARREQERAEAETAKAKAIQHFLEGTIARADPTKDAADVRLRDVILQAAGEIDGSFPDQAELRARLHLLVADCLHRLGAHGEFEQHARKACEAFGRAGLQESAEAAHALYLCGVVVQYRALRGSNSPEQVERGIADLTESARIYRLQAGDRQTEILGAEASVAYLKQLSAPLTEDFPPDFVQFVAKTWQEPDLEVVRRRLQGNLATITRLWESGDHQGAKDFLRQDYTAYLGNTLGRGLAAGFLHEMSRTAVKRELYPIAETCLELAYDFAAEAEGMRLEAAQAQVNLASFRRERGRPAEAIELYTPALAHLHAAFGPAHKTVVNVTFWLADALHAVDRLLEAESLLRQACADGRSEPKVSRIDFRHGLVLLALNLERQGEHATALTTLEEAQAVRLGAKDKPSITADDLRIHPRAPPRASGPAGRGRGTPRAALGNARARATVGDPQPVRGRSGGADERAGQLRGSAGVRRGGASQIGAPTRYTPSHAASVHAGSVHALDDARAGFLEGLDLAGAVPGVERAGRTADGVVAFEEARQEELLGQRGQLDAAAASVCDQLARILRVGDAQRGKGLGRVVGDRELARERVRVGGRQAHQRVAVDRHEGDLALEHLLHQEAHHLRVHLGAAAQDAAHARVGQRELLAQGLEQLGRREEHADLAVLQEQHGLRDHVLHVGLGTRRVARADQLLHPARVEVHEVARGAAEVGQVLDREAQAPRPGRSDHQPVAAAREALLVQRL